jgi:mxaL protein
MLLAILLLAVTFTNPTLQLERSTYRYVFVFDISQSMNVMDVTGTDHTITRLEYAKQTTLETLSKMPCGTEAGLALFAGHRAFLLITPIEICRNYRELSVMLNNINWRMSWENKSEIAKGLYKSIGLMELLNDNTRLVFITDGHEAPPINPESPPRFPGKLGEINGLILGVGGNTPVAIPKFDINTGEPQGFWKAEDVEITDTYTNRNGGVAASTLGTEHLSSLRESYLQGLAETTGLNYHRLAGSDNLYDLIKTRALGNPKMMTTDLRWLFALGALLAFISTLLFEPAKRILRDFSGDPIHGIDGIK